MGQRNRKRCCGTLVLPGLYSVLYYQELPHKSLRKLEPRGLYNAFIVLYNGILNLVEIREVLENTWKTAEQAYLKFAHGVDWVDCPSERDPSTVPATSFRELIVRNELYKMRSGNSSSLRESIFEAIDKAQQSDAFPKVPFRK